MADWFAAEADLARYKASIIRRDLDRVRRSMYLILAGIPRVDPWSPVARSADNPALDKLIEHESSLPLAVLGLQTIPRATLPTEQPDINGDVYLSIPRATLLAELRDIKEDKYESKLAYWKRLKDEAHMRAEWFVEMQQVFVELEGNVMMKSDAKTEIQKYGKLMDFDEETADKLGALVREAIWEDARHRAYRKALRQVQEDGPTE